MCKLRETEEDGEGKNSIILDGHMEIKKDREEDLAVSQSRNMDNNPSSLYLKKNYGQKKNPPDENKMNIY